MASETTLVALLIILFFGLITPELFKRLKVPFVTSLIIVGSVLGPHGFNYLENNEIIGFLGFLGMSFLMFMAGLETDMTKVSSNWKKIITLCLFNGIVPFLVGYLLTLSLGFGFLSSMLVGIIFVSSSVALVVQSLQSSNLFKSETGQIVLSSVLVLDIVSLVALSFVLQGSSPITSLPLYAYYAVLIVSIAFLILIIPKVIRFLFKRNFFSKAAYEEQLRFVIFIVVGVLSYFSLLGVHPILAGFIVGLALSGIVRDQVLFEKIHSLSYGIFVPVFFIIIGMELNLGLLTTIHQENLAVPLLIVALILSKYLSGYVGGRIASLTSKDSHIFGITSTSQLTTTLAVAYSASSIGVIDDVISTAIILLSVVTTILSPLALKIYLSVQKS